MSPLIVSILILLEVILEVEEDKSEKQEDVKFQSLFYWK
mgnify:CR=1 FL=1